jgi:putative transposase
MRVGMHVQPLTYNLRLPDVAQADALRLLEASRAVVNALLVALWPNLDAFGGEQRGPAWKQVLALTASPDPHGSRQFRCEAETAGRILRAQASRKQVFELVLPILSDGFIRPQTQDRPAGKHRQTMKEAILALEQTRGAEDETQFVTMLNVVEQACNYFLAHGAFPSTYEAMQAIPVLSVGLLTYAGDDGGEQGQAYRLSFDLEAETATLRLRVPDETGRWQWRTDPVQIRLPSAVLERLRAGTPLAPTLRAQGARGGCRVAVLDVVIQVPQAPLVSWDTVERVLGFDWGVHTLLTAVVLDANGHQISRPLFLNTGGCDGHQARTRRQIDALKARRVRLAPDAPQQAAYEAEIGRCWRRYHARNHALAHLAANRLLLFAAVWGCSLLSGESLATLKSTGRGRGVRGRWRNWRNNTTIRAEIWRILRYKCHLAGIRFRSERPRGTSHTCPRCGQPAKTFRSPRPAHRTDPVKWGRWLVCAHCPWSGDRDYAAALNIARLGVACLTHAQTAGKAQAFAVTETPSVKPVRYMPTGAVLLFPPPVPRNRLLAAGKLYVNGWKRSATLRSSYATSLLLRLCG